MHKRPSAYVALVALAALTLCASMREAYPFDLPLDVAALHGRYETVVVVDEESTPFPFNHASRSPQARTRLMASVASGDDRFGHLYLKGVARWDASDAAAFEFDQGDYLWARPGPVSHWLRVFANERRYFTHAIGPALITDDRVDAFENHVGVRADGERAALSWSALGTVLDDGGDDRRGMGFAAIRWRGASIQGTFSYLGRETTSDSLSHQGVFKGEVAGFYRRATLVVSYEHSGFGQDAFFRPGGRFDWDGYVGSNFSAVLPSAAAAFGELRVARLPLRDWGAVDFVHRYRTVGRDFVNRLAGATPGEVSNTTGLFLRHRRYALDGRLVYEKRVRSGTFEGSNERLLGQARALLANGSEVYLRAAVGHRDESGGRRTNDNFVHAALQRSMRRVQAGVHAMIQNIDDGDFDRRFAVEARVNWTASVAIYGRVLASQEAGFGNDAVYCRLEIRPVDHVFATLGFGRGVIGDGPYVVEDPDVGLAGSIESVYTLSVRGDF